MSVRNLMVLRINGAMLMMKAEKGGYKEYVMEITGERVYSKLKYEAGVHRVQRVRVHTSTATVAIMPEVLKFLCLLMFH